MPNWLQVTTTVLVALIMAFAQLGLVIPIFPGNLIIWLAALVYGVSTGFGTLGAWMFVLITVMLIAALLADNVLMGAKARSDGASWGSIFTALAAGVVGTFAFPPVGGLIAAPLALYGMEYYRLRDRDQALKITKSLLWGYGMAFVVRFALGLLMIALWAIWAFA